MRTEEKERASHFHRLSNVNDSLSLVVCTGMDFVQAIDKRGVQYPKLHVELHSLLFRFYLSTKEEEENRKRGEEKRQERRREKGERRRKRGGREKKDGGEKGKESR